MTPSGIPRPKFNCKGFIDQNPGCETLPCDRGRYAPVLVLGQISSCFNCSNRGITSMPSIFGGLVVWFELVGGFLGC
jgi:hypothetical protein